MDARVVCISRTVAAGGEGVARGVAERLGFRCVDEEIIVKAAEKAQVDPSLIAESEHRQPLLKRILDTMALSAALPDPAIYPVAMPAAFYELEAARAIAIPEDYRSLIREVIVETANLGRVVIVAHAASMALGGREDVLRVLVTASTETRARRLMASGQLSEKDAVTAVKKSDQERRDYFKRFYKLNEELPTHYDIVINTDLLNPEQVVNVIVRVAKS